MSSLRAPTYATEYGVDVLPDNLVAEIVDGELHASPRPALRHSRAELSLGRAIGGPYDDGIDGPGGWWILVEPELHLGRHVLVPDLAGWRRSRMAELPDAAYASLSPDWVCEVLSPATASFDRVKKLAVYAREAVAHVWFVDPALGTLEVLKLDGPRWVLAGSSARRRCRGARRARTMLSPAGGPFETLPACWGERQV